MVSGRYFNWIGMHKGLSMEKDGFKCFTGFGSVQNWFGCCDETEACCLSFYSEYLQSNVQTGKKKVSSRLKTHSGEKFENTQWSKV